MRIRRRTAAALAGITLAGVAGIGVAAAANQGADNPLSDALAGLVSKGTITQEQADAVEKALTTEREKARQEHDQWRDQREAELDTLLKDTLGMTSEELRNQLRAGGTLKEIAGDKAEELADGFVALAEKHAAQAVEAGRITQEQAVDMVARARERVDAWLAGTDDGLGRGLGLGLLGRGGAGMSDDGRIDGGRRDGMGPGHGHGGMGPGWGGGEDSAEGTTPNDEPSEDASPTSLSPTT